MADSSSNSYDLEIARIKATTDILIELCGKSSVYIEDENSIKPVCEAWKSLYQAISSTNTN